MRLLSGSKGGNGDGDAPAAHQPPPWVGWLLLISLLVMLNTHMFMTLAVDIDQYSIYTADTGVRQPYPTAWAQGSYPALLAFIFNVLLAFIAYGLYRFIWWRFTAGHATEPGRSERNPFKQNAIALAIPVGIAMMPSIVLAYTALKPYFLIVGALIVIVLCIVGSLKDPDVDLDSSTRREWFNVAVVATIVMMALAVAVTFYFQVIQPVTPTHNMIWELRWNRSPLDEFETNIMGGMFLFGLVSIIYMVAVLGGVLLSTLRPPRIGLRSQEFSSTTEAAPHTPGSAPLQTEAPVVDVSAASVPVAGNTAPPRAAPQMDPPQGATPPVVNIQVVNMAEGGSVYTTRIEPQTAGHSDGPDPAAHPRASLPEEGSPELSPETPQEDELPDEDLAPPEQEISQGSHTPIADIPPDVSAEEWTRVIVGLLEDMSLESDEEPSYLAVVSGQEIRIADNAYRLLVDGRNGFLPGVDLLVDLSTKTVKTQWELGLGNAEFNTHPRNGRYRAVCIFCKKPREKFTAERLRTLIKNETGAEIVNMSDLLRRLREQNVPLESSPTGRETYIRDDAKTIFVERLTTTRRRVRADDRTGSDMRGT